MKNKNLFAFICTAVLIAFLAIACDVGTVDYPTETPDIPYEMSARMTEDGRGISLKWSAPDGGDEVRGYEIYRWNNNVTDTVNGAVIHKNPDDINIVRDTQYIDSTEIIAGNRYFYKVRAYNGAGLGIEDTADYMAAIVVPPLPVQKLSAKELNSYSIKLDWETSVGATEYYIYRSETLDGNYDSIAAIAAPSLVYIDDNKDALGKAQGLKPHTWYYYKIQSSNTTQNGSRAPLSDARSAKTKLAPPDWLKVEILNDNVEDAVNGLEQDVVRIRWLAVSGAIGYQLYFDTGLQSGRFELPKAYDSGNQTISPFKKYAAVAPDVFDTLEYIDRDFTVHGLSKGTRLFYKACGVEVFDQNNDYQKDIIGDKSEINIEKNYGFATKINGN